MKDFLEIIILGKDIVAKEFSDKFMIQNLVHTCTANTVREIRRRLYDEGIIEKSRTGPSGEKFYKIKDIEKAKTLYQENIGLYVLNRERKPRIAITPFGVIDNPPKNLDSKFCLKLELDDKKWIWFYPKISYKEKICPICSGKLIEYRHGKLGKSEQNKGVPAHDLDRKCSKCKCKFHYNASSLDKFRKVEIEFNQEVKEFIEIEPSSKISNYLIKRWIDEDRMKFVLSETQKFLGKINPNSKKFF